MTAPGTSATAVIANSGLLTRQEQSWGRHCRTAESDPSRTLAAEGHELPAASFDHLVGACEERGVKPLQFP